jgi:hypothetical protein
MARILQWAVEGCQECCASGSPRPSRAQGNPTTTSPRKTPWGGGARWIDDVGRTGKQALVQRVGCGSAEVPGPSATATDPLSQGIRPGAQNGRRRTRERPGNPRLAAEDLFCPNKRESLPVALRTDRTDTLFPDVLCLTARARTHNHTSGIQRSVRSVRETLTPQKTQGTSANHPASPDRCHSPLPSGSTPASANRRRSPYCARRESTTTPHNRHQVAGRAPTCDDARGIPSKPHPASVNLVRPRRFQARGIRARHGKPHF